MALFLLLIILLAIAWGLADYQLQQRIERPQPRVPTSKTAPVAAPAAPATPPAANAVGSIPPASEIRPASESERAAAPDTPQAPPQGSKE